MYDFSLPTAVKHTLEIDSIRLIFGERLILSDVYLKVETGDVIGLLGRNGEGKSSLMRVAYGTIEADKSTIIDGESIPAPHLQPQMMHYLPQNNLIPKFLTVKRAFNDFGVNFEEFAEHFPEIQSQKTSRIDRLSSGMRRVAEIYLIVKSPSYFALLDEPFSQVSPVMIEKLKQIINEERDRKGFIITDHMYRHVLDFCNPIYLLSHGKTELIKGNEDLISKGYLRN